jgi:hypothetical protein
MQAAIKRLNSSCPQKVQTEMMLFTGKRADNKNSHARSYTQAASPNCFEALSVIMRMQQWKMSRPVTAVMLL